MESRRMVKSGLIQDVLIKSSGLIPSKDIRSRDQTLVSSLTPIANEVVRGQCRGRTTNSSLQGLFAHQVRLYRLESQDTQYAWISMNMR